MSGRTSASAIAMELLRERVADGKTISFPSLGIELTAANLKGNGMSDNDHAAAITRWSGAILATLPDELQEHRRACEDIRTHADALAEQLAEAEARAAEQEHLADMLQSRMRDAASALDRWRAVNAVAAEGALETVYAALMADPP